jgi:CBS domain containing-hemolysin-like protein
MLALLTTVGVALGVSFLCSILEAALLSVRTTELVERAGREERGARMLLDLKQNQLDDSISSILILNTIAHTIGAAVAGAQAAVLFGEAWLGVFSAVLTLLVLVLTEIIPKTFGAARASQLVPFVAITLTILLKLLLPLLLFTRVITRFIGKSDHTQISRGEVAAMVESAAEEGLLESHESQIVGNVLQMGSVPIQAVMTPRPVVFKVAAETSINDLAEADDVIFTRVPIFEGGEENIIGYVRVPDVLLRAYKGEGDVPVRELLRPLPSFEATETVGDTLRALMRAGQHIALVRGEFGGMAGLVTLEDLIETLLGAEIVDESDHVADLRQLAIEMRDKRLGRRATPPEIGD